MKKMIHFSILTFVIVVSITQAQQFSIVIDAEKDAFYETLTGPSDGFVFLPSRCQVIGIGVTPTDDADCSGKIWFAYDNDYLYCYAEIKDDYVLVSNTQRFENDCVELKLDPNPNAGTGAGTANSRLTALSADDAGAPSGADNLNVSGNLVDAASNKWVPTISDYSRGVIEGGYKLEFRIPFSFINRPQDSRFMISREVGAKFGLAINIGDNDATAREHMLQWSAGHTNDVHTDGKFHGTATFLANNKLGLTAVSPRDPNIKNDSADVWYTISTTAIKGNPLVNNYFELSNNYPNPFNPSTVISYHLLTVSNVTLKVYDVLGREIATLADGIKEAGHYNVTFSAIGGYASGGNASHLSSGIYIARLTAIPKNGQMPFIQNRKMILTK